MLRAMRASDAPAYAQAFREDSELGRLLGVEQDPSEADVIGRIEGSAARAEEGRGVELAVCTVEDDALHGGLVLHSFAWKHRRCELGFWLVPSARGQGLARAAVECALTWAFDDLAIERMEMTTIPENAPTRRLAHALGFQEEGAQRLRNIERGVRVDIVLFGLLADDWQARTRVGRRWRG